MVFAIVLARSDWYAIKRISPTIGNTIIKIGVFMPKGFAHFKDECKDKYVLYKTKIVEIDTSSIILNSGGWLTNHTKKCINIALENTGYKVSQKKGQWFVSHPLLDSELKFSDGMRLERQVS